MSTLSLSEQNLILSSLDQEWSKCCPACFCDSAKSHKICSKDRDGLLVSFYACSTCGLIYANPYFTDSALEHFYSDLYTKMYSSPNRFRSYRQCRKSIFPLLKPYLPPRGSLLDYGCGNNGMLRCFDSARFSRVGVDLSIKEHRASNNIDFYPVDEFWHSKSNFDVIILSQVLEHIPQPSEFLKALLARLNPSGVIYIGVPGLKRVLSLENPYLGLKACHRSLFSESNLLSLCQHNGLELLHMTSDIHAILRNNASTPITVDFTSALRDSNTFISGLSNGNAKKDYPKRNRFLNSAANKMYERLRYYLHL